MVTVSVPGKVILMGDHAVVYGKPALIAAVNMRLRATVSGSDRPEIIAVEGTEYIKHILAAVCKHFQINNTPPLRIEISSDIPIGYHLGSSAALGAALVGALSYHLKRIWNPTRINQLAYESEKFIHINSSGVDPAAVVSGGLIWYRKELDFLRSIWQLPFKIPVALNHFYLIDTGRPKESTGDMVSFVAKQKNLKQFLYENEVQTKCLATALKKGDEKTFIDAMQKGERSLEAIGVVSKKVVPIIRNIEKQGGAAKILGGGGRAGGVGYLLCYSHNPPQENIPIILGEEGIRLEKTS